MNPLIDKIKSADAKFIYMMLAGVIVVIVLLDFFLVMRLQLGGLASLGKKNVQMKADIATLKTNKQRLGQFQKQLEIAQRDVKNFNAMVHKKDEIPVVLKAISTIANEYGVKIDQLVPQAPDPKPVVQNEDGKYLGQVIFVRANTGYHQLGRFLSRIEQEHLFWQLNEFVVTADEGNPQRHHVKMEMKILLLEK